MTTKCITCRLGGLSYVLLTFLATSLLHSEQAVATWRAEVSMQRPAFNMAFPHRWHWRLLCCRAVLGRVAAVAWHNCPPGSYTRMHACQLQCSICSFMWQWSDGAGVISQAACATSSCHFAYRSAK